MDQTKALMRYICMRHDMYPEDKMERFSVERVVEVIYGDCRFYDPSCFKAEDRV